MQMLRNINIHSSYVIVILSMILMSIIQKKKRTAICNSQKILVPFCAISQVNLIVSEIMQNILYATLAELSADPSRLENRRLFFSCAKKSHCISDINPISQSLFLGG